MAKLGDVGEGRGGKWAIRRVGWVTAATSGGIVIVTGSFEAMRVRREEELGASTPPYTSLEVVPAPVADPERFGIRRVSWVLDPEGQVLVGSFGEMKLRAIQECWAAPTFTVAEPVPVAPVGEESEDTIRRLRLEVDRLTREHPRLRWCACGQPWLPGHGLYEMTTETECRACVLRRVIDHQNGDALREAGKQLRDRERALVEWEEVIVRQGRALAAAARASAEELERLATKVGTGP